MLKKILLVSGIATGAMHLPAQEKEQWAAPVEKNGIYSIRMKGISLEANPQTGGRISALKSGDHNFLTGRDINATYWGSSFWPSPQNVWKSANLAELDITIEAGNPELVTYVRNLLNDQKKLQR